VVAKGVGLSSRGDAADGIWWVGRGPSAARRGPREEFGVRGREGKAIVEILWESDMAFIDRGRLSWDAHAGNCSGAPLMSVAQSGRPPRPWRSARRRVGCLASPGLGIPASEAAGE